MATSKSASLDDLSTVAGCILGIIGLIIAVPLYFYQAWAITVLWSWFVVPTWGGPQLPVLTVLGLTYMTNLIWPRYGMKADSEAEEGKSPGEKIVMTLLTSFFVTSFCLGAGWVIHLVQGSPLQ